MSCNCINNNPCNPESSNNKLDSQDSTQVINNIVYNLADNEDLEEVIQDGKTVLHFKDKLYQPEEYSGYGRVWLRKNIKKSSLCDCCDDTEKNILTLDMFFKQDNISPNTNTIYIVLYDYDLDGNTITIPSDSVLVFDGGSFSNGQVILDNTLVVPPTLDLNNVFKNITIGGTYKEGLIIYKDKYLQYWDGKKWCVIQDTSSILNMIDNLYKFLKTLTVCVNINRTEDKTSYDIQLGGTSRGIIEVPTSYIKTVTLHDKNYSPDSNGNIDLGDLNITFKVGTKTVIYNLKDGTTVDLTDLIN